jgi:anti-sigma regulatory factor (Ser/Thr protein kinase)
VGGRALGDIPMLELSLHILDLLENSVEAGATRIELLIDEDLSADRLTIEVRDNGRGMDEETLARVGDAFFTTRKTRRVGLGLPLFSAAAELCEGELRVESQVGKGTRVIVTFQHSHIDRAPLGDVKSTLMALLLAEPPVDLHYVHRLDGRAFEFDTAEIREALGDMPLSHPTARRWLSEFIRQGEGELYSV